MSRYSAMQDQPESIHKPKRRFVDRLIIGLAVIFASFVFALGLGQTVDLLAGFIR